MILQLNSQTFLDLGKLLFLLLSDRSNSIRPGDVDDETNTLIEILLIDREDFLTIKLKIDIFGGDLKN